MKINSLKILLVEDTIADADLIKEFLSEENIVKLNLTYVKRVRDALEILGQDSFDAILLDLSLPDSTGIEGITQVKQKAPELPIIVLTSLNDQDMALRSVRQGAQDYLIKGRFDGELLLRSIRYAIERQRTEATLRQQAKRERLMGKMLERIHQSLNLQEILQTTVAEVQQFLQTDRVLIYRCESDQPGEIVVEAYSFDYLQSSKLQSNLSLEQLSLSLTNTYKVQAIEDAEQLNNIYSLAEHQIKAILTLPIWQSQSFETHNTLLFSSKKITVDTDEESKSDSTHSELNCEIQPRLVRGEGEPTGSNTQNLWGMLVAHNYHTPRKWQDWEIAFLQHLATQVTIAIQQSELYSQLEKANQQLKQLAILDGLTGVANRRYFDRALNNEWQRLTREQKPLSLILCDIDYFKIYNDTYGHPAGDRCLKQVAKVLQLATKRPADLVARYGGEEFVVILPDTNAKGALFVANSICQELEKLQLPHHKSNVSQYVTLSVGVATRLPDSSQTANILINMADEALYRAKEQGRNQIVQYEL